MTLPALYKYLGVEGARKTLGNRTFRHTKPSTFEDLEDMTVQSVFPEDVEAALATLSDGCVDVIIENVNVTPTCKPQLAKTVEELQGILRSDPGMAEALKEQMKESGIFDAEQMRATAEAFVKETNEFMQGYRVLCVTTDRASERMWEDCAEDHQGIVLRIEPSTEKDSKLTRFRPVTYRRSRPAIYDQTLDFMKDSLFADQEAKTQAILDKIIYAKTLPYKFENEYRLAIPSGEDGDWDTLPYYPEEITELYLGLAMTKSDKNDIVAKAKTVNPKIAIFQVDRDANRKLTFRSI
jgi:hypothetical protein